MPPPLAIIASPSYPHCIIIIPPSFLYPKPCTVQGSESRLPTLNPPDLEMLCVLHMALDVCLADAEPHQATLPLPCSPGRPPLAMLLTMMIELTQTMALSVSVI